MTIEKLVKEFDLKRILVADDREENISSYKQIFKDVQDTCVDYVYSGKDAIDSIKKNSYDLVLTDKNMENEYSGYDVVYESLQKNIPVYLITTYDHTKNHTEISPSLVDGDIKLYRTNGIKDDVQTLKTIFDYLYTSKTFEIMKGVINGTIKYCEEQNKEKFEEAKIDFTYDIIDLLEPKSKYFEQRGWEYK